MTDHHHMVPVVDDDPATGKAPRDDNEMWRSLVKSFPDFVMNVGQDGTVLYINRVAPGKTVEQVIGTSLYDYMPPEHRDLARNSIEGVLRTGEPDHYETSVVMPGYETIWYSTRVGPIERNGKVESVVLVSTDITKRIQAEERLQDSESKYKTLLENLPQKIFFKDRNSVYISCNKSFADDLGIKPDEIVGKTDNDFFPKELAEKYQADDKRIMEAGEIEEIEENYIEDGQEQTVHTVKTPIADENGNCIGVLGIFWDVTDRKRAEWALRESEQRHRALFEGAAEGILVADVETRRLRLANPAVCRMLGYPEDELLQLSVPDLHSEDDLERVMAEFEALMQGEKSLSSDIPFQRKDGSILYADVCSAPKILDGRQCGVGFLTDVSERREMQMRIAEDEMNRKRMEVELHHAQKLEAVGQLAAGIAHEINTPTQFVGDSVTFLKESFADLMELVSKYQEAFEALNPAPEQKHIPGDIREAEEMADLEYLQEHVPRAFKRTFEGIQRVTIIVRAMKDFAHPDQRAKSSADLNQALRNTLTISRNEYKYVAEVEMDLGELPLVPCHVGDLNQAFLNIIVNAAQAIAEVVGDSGERGRIFVSTAAEGDTVRISIRDTGCGIPEEIRSRIFDPFFTTKEVGKGSGQGLAISRSMIVDKHNGSLTCESEVGRGTTFIIRLPVNGKEGSLDGVPP